MKMESTDYLKMNVPGYSDAADILKVSENFETLMGAIVKARPASLKGVYLKSIALTSTMGPGVRLNTIKYGA